MRFAEERSYKEVLLVLFLTLGYPILASLAIVFDGGISTARIVTSVELVSTVIYEVLVLGVVAVFLTRRGLLLEDVKLEINWRLTITGLILACCCMLLTSFANLLLPLIGVNAAKTVFAAGADGLGIPAILGISVVNPVFEEVIVVSYLQGMVLKEEAPTKAINISVGIRLLYHLYQGVAGVITIIPMGLLFSYYYYKNRKLWPLILAHGIMDFVALVSL